MEAAWPILHPWRLDSLWFAQTEKHLRAKAICNGFNHILVGVEAGILCFPLRCGDGNQVLA